MIYTFFNDYVLTSKSRPHYTESNAIYPDIFGKSAGPPANCDNASQNGTYLIGWL